MVNPKALMKLMEMKNTFDRNHPKFGSFLKYVTNESIAEGSVIEIAVVDPNGKKVETNLKLTQSDIEMIKELKGMGGMF